MTQKQQTTKVCIKCDIEKPIEKFIKKENRCKACKIKYNVERQRNKETFFCKLYTEQKYSSIKRNHAPPMYTLKELEDEYKNTTQFKRLFKEWENSNYEKYKKPSFDRLDNNKGYSLDNIQLVTWEENDNNAHSDMRKGILIHGTKPQKQVSQYTKDGEFINKFVSIREAGRNTGVDYGNISRAVSNKKIAGGFLWK